MSEFLPGWLVPLMLALFGASIGSFLNVVIYRMPEGISLNEPSRSFCPKCKKMIPWYCNIPVFSWLVLGGRCAFCKSRISFRYWFVEVLTTCLFLAVAIRYDHTPLYTQFLICIWVAFAVAVSFIDAETMLVFPRQTFLAAIIGLLTALSYPLIISVDSFSRMEALSYSVLGGAAGFIGIWMIVELGRLFLGSWSKVYEERAKWSLKEPDNENEELQLVLPDRAYEWSDLFTRPSDKAVFSDVSLVVDGVNILTNKFYLYEDRLETEDGDIYMLEDIVSAEGTVVGVKANREVMGMGDAWIMLMIGTLIGWQGCLFSLIVGSFVGIAFAVVSRIGLGRQVPFGPCLLVSAVFWVLGGKYLWLSYLDWIGLY